LAHLVLSFFLKIGQIKAIYSSEGKTPSASDLFMINLRGFANEKFIIIG
jgi:hypothetical protein